MLKADIMEGSISRGEPSTLNARIVDGSRLKRRTFHELGAYHGWFISQKRTFHAGGPYHGWFDI